MGNRNVAVCISTWLNTKGIVIYNKKLLWLFSKIKSRKRAILFHA